jgi:hypothetical protein
VKGKKLWIAFGVLLTSVVLIAVIQSGSRESAKPDRAKQAGSEPAVPARTNAKLIPAHYETPPAMRDLAAILPSSQFAGKTRQAYEAVKQIPVTIAQMPCYCHCDKGMGHKSLHSCFEDDHAAHCATCVDEALMAYRLQKEEGLSPAQIRERIIAQYSEQ